MTNNMKNLKKTVGKFPKAVNKVIPKMKQTKGQTKLMTVKERLALQKKLAHFEATKDLPTI